VRNYRFGSIFATLPPPEIEPSTSAPLLNDVRYARKLQRTLSLSTVSKYTYLTTMPTGHVESALSTIDREIDAISALPPKELWDLRALEWESAIEWCQLQVCYFTLIAKSDRMEFWRDLELLIENVRLQGLRNAVETSTSVTMPTQVRVQSWFSLAEALRHQGATAEAVSSFRTAANIAMDGGLDHNMQYKCLANVGHFLSTIRESAMAERYLRVALNVADSNETSTFRKCEASLLLSHALCEQQKYQEAESVVRSALLLASNERADGGTTHKCYLEIGRILQSQDRLVEAREYLEVASRLAKEEGVSTNDVCDGLQTMGHVLRSMERFSESEQVLREAVELLDDRVAALIRCNCLSGLGILLSERSRNAEAEQYLVSAAEIAIGEDLNSVTKATCLYALGRVLESQEKYREAEPIGRLAVQIASENDVGALTRCNAITLLGSVICIQGRREEAEPLFRAAAQIAEEHLLGATTRCNTLCVLGRLLRVRGNYQEAEAHLKHAAELAEGNDISWQTKYNIMHELGKALNAAERYREAESVLQVARSIAVAHDLAAQSQCDSMLDLAWNLAMQREYTKAEALVASASRIIEEHALGILTRLEASRQLAYLMAQQGRLGESLRQYKLSCRLLLDFLATHTSLDGVPHLISACGDLFANGRYIAEVLWRQGHSHDALWDVVMFWDAERCVCLRERLRCHISGTKPSANRGSLAWESGPVNWRALFERRPDDAQRAGYCGLRGVRQCAAETMAADDSVQPPESGPKVAVAQDDSASRFCEPFDRCELTSLLRSDQTVIVGFFADGDDIVVLPIRKHRFTRQAFLLHIEHEEQRGLFRLSGIRPRLEELLAAHVGRLQSIREQDVGASARSLNEECNLRASVYAPLYAALQLHNLLRVITYHGEATTDLHVIVIPDEFLLALPLHAAFDEHHRTTFLSQVGSLSYALSLRTLELQRRIEVADGSDCSTIQATVFAYPDFPRRFGAYLSFAWREVEELEQAWGMDAISIYGENEPGIANRSNLRKRHACGNIYYNIGHGGKVRDVDIVGHDGEHYSSLAYSVILADGPVSDLRMVEEGYDFTTLRLAHFSSCLLGKLEAKDQGHELEGLTASLTFLGCRRMSSALWELCDQAASRFGGCLAKALRQHAFVEYVHPHAFAIAFRQALLEFQRIDDGHWNHEFYWAPYVLYGLP